MRSLSPFLRAEGWGEGQTPDRCKLLDLYPLTRMSSSMPSDLSPQAGARLRRVSREIRVCLALSQGRQHNYTRFMLTEIFGPFLMVW
jgi:hypothetical protein